MEIQVPGSRPRGLRRATLVTALALCGVAAGCGSGPAGDRTADQADAPDEVVLTPEAAREGRAKQSDDEPQRKSKAQVVQLQGVGADRLPPASPADDAPSPGAPTDAEVRAELRQARAALASFKKHLNTTAFLQTGPRARVLADGTAVAPDNAPEVVKRVILAANEIAKFPYKWGGGHGAWRDTGYDCSGSVSFALAAAGLLDAPLASGPLMSWGEAGAGKWVTIWSSPAHVFMEVAGIRFDTSGQRVTGSRWQNDMRSTAGFVARHPRGL